MSKASLNIKAKKATHVLRGKIILTMRRYRASEVLIEFTDGTRLYVHGPRDSSLELSVRGGAVASLPSEQ